MAVESKPLFHPEIIRQQLRHFVLPAAVEDSRPRLKHWADLISYTRPAKNADPETIRRSDIPVASP